MSKRHKMNRNNKVRMPLKTSKRIVPIVIIIGLALVAAVSLGFGIWKSNNSAVAEPTFENLKGRWVRTDGGYVLEVRQVAVDGKIDAAYLNPKPINVSKAKAASEAGQIKVFVELRDQLYPGSYYTLKYDGGKDQLAGVYHHLGIKQQFDVVFIRTK